MRRCAGKAARPAASGARAGPAHRPGAQGGVLRDGAGRRQAPGERRRHAPGGVCRRRVPPLHHVGSRARRAVVLRHLPLVRRLLRGRVAIDVKPAPRPRSRSCSTTPGPNCSSEPPTAPGALLGGRLGRHRGRSGRFAAQRQQLHHARLYTIRCRAVAPHLLRYGKEPFSTIKLAAQNPHLGPLAGGIGGEAVRGQVLRAADSGRARQKSPPAKCRLRRPAAH